MNIFDETGLYTMTYDELRALIASRLSALPGCSQAGVDDEDSVIGKITSIVAELFADVNEMIQYVKQSADPNDASGVALRRLTPLTGTTPGSGSKSTVELTCEANAAGVPIAAGSLVSDPNNPGIQYATDSELVLAPYASDVVAATCTENGANTGAAGTLTQIDTPLYGWKSVTNASAVTPGTDEEASSVLRRRRNRAAKRYGTSTLFGVWAALEDVDNVDEVTLYQNLTDTTDDLGLPPRSMMAVVDGGDDDDIAQTLFEFAPIRTVGDEAIECEYRGHTYTINFQRPTEIAIDIELTFAPLSTSSPATWPGTGSDTVKAAVLAWVAENQTSGVNAEPNAIAGAASVIDGFYVSLCEIAEHGDPVSGDSVDAGIYDKITTTLGYITVNS